MKRRNFLGALTCLPPAALAVQDAAGPQRPRYKISAAQLHSSLAARFPLRLGMEDFLQLQVSAPRLHLLPARNRLGAGLVAQASGAMLPKEGQGGELDISFDLAYAPADRTVRARDPELLDLRLPGLPPEARRPLQAMFMTMARHSLGEVVLHRFSDADLALADTMGFEPERMEVVEDGLMVLFGEKARR